jgi:hypothetical protein
MESVLFREKFIDWPDKTRVIGRRSSSSVADPGSGDFLISGSGMGNNSGSGSRIRDEQPQSYFRELRNHFLGLKYFNFLIGSGMEKIRIRESAVFGNRRNRNFVP